MPCGTWPGGHVPRRALDVPRLVVEVEVGLEFAQERALVEPAEEHRLVDRRCSSPSACGSRARAPGALRAVTSAVRSFIRPAVATSTCSRCSASSSGLNGPGGSGRAACSRLVRLERRQSLRLVDALGLVGEQHGVAVEGDAHLVGMRVRGRRLRVDDRRGKARRRAPRARPRRSPTGRGWPSSGAR